MDMLSRLVLTFLLNAVWQVTLVAGVAAVCTRLLRRAPARYLHVLWVGALALGVALPFVSLRDSWKPADRPPVQFQGLPRESTVIPAARIATARPQVSLPGKLARALSTAPTQVDGPRHASWLPLTGLFRHRSQPISLPPLFVYAALGFYLLTLLGHLTRMARAWRRTIKLRRAARPYDLPEGMAALATQCRTALRLEHVSILCSSQATGPAVMGLRKPVIILPEALLQASPAGDLTAALCHEMAHIRRHDYLVNLICEFAFLPITFHPVAWLVRRRIEETRELACDEAAAGQLVSASDYARSLLSLARAMCAPTSLSRPRYTLGVFDANILEERIMRLLEKRPRFHTRRRKIGRASCRERVWIPV